MRPAFVFLVALWISAFNLGYMVLGEDSSEVLPSATLCLNCTVSQNLCQPLSPLSVYPSYGASPPPPPFSGYPSFGAATPPLSLSTYPSYVAPPPPSRPVQANCPPVPVQCCLYPSHPNSYEYEPLDDHSPTLYMPLSTYRCCRLLFCSSSIR